MAAGRAVRRIGLKLNKLGFMAHATFLADDSLAKGFGSVLLRNLEKISHQ